MKAIDFHKILVVLLSAVLIIIIFYSSFGGQCFNLLEIIASYSILLYNILIIIYEEARKY